MLYSLKHSWNSVRLEQALLLLLLLFLCDRYYDSG